MWFLATLFPSKPRRVMGGLGAGIRQIEAKTVDFGASDAPLVDDELGGPRRTGMRRSCR